MIEEKMRRKIGEIEEIDCRDNFGGCSLNDRWGILQENLAKEIEAGELKQEKVWVKEGQCDECGVFDVLSRVEDRFICAECSKLFKNNGKSKNIKRKK